MDVISDFPVDLKLAADKTKAHWMKKKKKYIDYYRDDICLFVLSSGTAVYSDLCQ